ncbi:MAG: AbrB/MazE/SpoVT family DNA-binding domain-containing protein [Candidatus Pacebacteria bacterium]|nr:AbrB/MazE/SpoVT family DNA-binding domain-containing protein [Candidatus Paceibacterota bacterium]MBP9866793.1 AbrB/MazE/SpoVT family DNA-binding domain-containing protein [Candidatus Paceibacterota bacterium]
MKTTSQERIQKITSKGQITLPVAWRNMTKTNTILVTQKGDTLHISPARLEKGDPAYTVFDAIRDNNGKGIKATELVKILKKLQ